MPGVFAVFLCKAELQDISRRGAVELFPIDALSGDNKTVSYDNKANHYPPSRDEGVVSCDGSLLACC